MSDYRSLLERYVERYNAGDLDAIMELYADDAVQWMPDGVYEGRGTIRERLAKELAAFSEVEFGFTSFVEQDDGFADEWTFLGTHTGPFVLPDGSELPATGKRVQIKGMELVRIRDGKIVIDNLYYDNVTVAAQLGLLPRASHVELHAHVKIRPGELEGFKAQAAEIMRIAREQDTRTTRYDWFIKEDGTECEVHEGYVNEEGLFEHNIHVMDARAVLFEKYAFDHRMTVFGDVSQEFRDLSTKHAGGITVYSFFQGLEVT